MTIEKFSGDDLTVDRYDELAMKAIGAKFLACEAELFGTKWFDYRHLHPTAATYLFAHHYTLQYRRTFQRIRDQSRGSVAIAVANPNLKIIDKEVAAAKKQRLLDKKALAAAKKMANTPDLKAEYKLLKKEFDLRVKDENREFDERRRSAEHTDIMKVEETLGFWKARQMADTIGMPYDLFLSMAMRILIEDNIWQRIPRPVHLYSDKVRDLVTEEWERTLNEVGIVEPHTAHLSDDNAFDIQCKQDIARWLCERLLVKKHPHFGLAYFMCDKNLIPEHIALQFFESSIIKKAYDFHAE